MQNCPFNNNDYNNNNVSLTLSWGVLYVDICFHSSLADYDDLLTIFKDAQDSVERSLSATLGRIVLRLRI